MTALPGGRPAGRRPQLGSPIIPVNAPGAYLRHRVAAEHAYRARRRLLWWYRLAVSLAMCAFYLLIGRDLITVIVAKKDNAKMEIAHEATELRRDIKQMAGARAQLDDQVASGTAPVALPVAP